MSHCHALIEALRSRGYRITPQREMIIEALAHSDHHINAEEVFELVRVRTRSMDIATVYRTLELLVGEGLASGIDLGKGQVVYATNQHGPHIHLVCRQCGQVIDARHELLESMNQQLQARYQFSADLQHISVLGLCSDCQTK